MTAGRKPTPRDFPVLWNARDIPRSLRQRGTYQRCSVCNLLVDARNRPRHVKACHRRKRLVPELWAEWKRDMHRSAA